MEHAEDREREMRSEYDSIGYCERHTVKVEVEHPSDLEAPVNDSAPFGPQSSKNTSSMLAI